MIGRNRAGLALPAAVFVMAIVVLFIAGSAFAATQEARASIGALAERAALEAAEHGATAVLRDWDPVWNVATPVGRTIGPLTRTLSGGSASTVHLTRTTATTWWIVSEGSVSGVAARAARRTVNAVLRLDVPSSPLDAALAVDDSARVTGTGVVTGIDSVEAFVTCAGIPAVPAAGIAAPDTTRIAGSAGVTGAPPVMADSGVIARLAAIDSMLTPDIVLPAGAIVTPAPAMNAGVCDTLVALNWGDPAGGACGDHLPVIRALGDLTIRGGIGQGVLVAAGDVWVENGAFFAGIVIAMDDFVTGNGGGSVLGAVLAGDARRGAGDQTVVASGGSIRRSSCRVQRSRLAAAEPVRVRQRWWLEFE